MIYRFVFGKGRLALFLSGLVVLGLLVFAAGLLAGMRWQLAREDGVEMATEPAAATSAAASPAAGTAPAGRVSAPAAVTPTVTQPTVTGPRVSAAGVAGPTATKPVVQPPRPPSARAPTVATAAGAVAAAGAGTAAADPPAVPATTPPENAATDLTPPTIYELQLGLYMREEDAATFAATMAERGYEAYLVEVESSRGSILFTPRLGPFPSMEAAAVAARSFERDQGFQPIIRFRRQPAPAPSAPSPAEPEAAADG